jgi:hypothetical protein
MREDTRRQVLYRHLLRSMRGRSSAPEGESTADTVESNFSAVLACSRSFSLDSTQSRDLTADD